MSGALPSDRASRPSAQAPAGLGDTATIPSARVLGWDDPLWFGKYRGLLVREVASFNPAYLAWAATNLDWFDLTQDARSLGQQELNKHRSQSLERQNGWAWGFGRAVKSAAESWRNRLIRLEAEARRALKVRDAQAIEARRAETAQTGSVHESAVPEGNAP